MEQETLDKIMHNLMANTTTGIPTGIENLDRRLGGGFQKGQLYVLGGRPAMGKTIFACQAALNAAIRENKKVIYYSLDMSKELLIKEMLFNEAKVSGGFMTELSADSVLESAEWRKLTEAKEKIAGSKLYVVDTPAISAEGIGLRLSGDIETDYMDADLIVIDHLKFLNATEDLEANARMTYMQKEEYIFKKLREIAGTYNVPILLLATISMECEERGKRNGVYRPMLADLKKTPAMKEYADVIIFLYRDQYYYPDTELKSIAEFIVARNRIGTVGTDMCGWIPEMTRFANLESNFDARTNGEGEAWKS